MAKLIICGSGRTVWDDLGRIPDWDLYDSMAVNDSIMHFPGRLDHAYSNDWKMLPRWVDARRPENAQLDKNLRLHSCFGRLGSDARVQDWDVKVHGTSSLVAVYIGLEMGYEQIILCGIPLDNKGHYFDPPWKRTNFQKEVPTKTHMRDRDYLKYWSNAKEGRFKGRVYSMSGRTRDLLGEPEFTKAASF